MTPQSQRRPQEVHFVVWPQALEIHAGLLPRQGEQELLDRVCMKPKCK